MNDLTKVISYRVLSLITTLIISMMYFGEIKKSLPFTIILMSALTILHYIFEKIWNRAAGKEGESR